MSNSGRYCITEAIPEVKESCWGFWLCKGVYGFNEGSSNDAFDRMSTCCTLIFNSLLAGVPRQARSPAASASWFERLLLCTRWARWHFASRPKNRWSPFSSFSDACYFLQFVSQVQCMHIYIYFLIFLAIDQFTVLCFACAESPRIGPYEYSEAMQLAPEDWRRTGMPNEYPGLENGVR